jgi:hypothetical protein
MRVARQCKRAPARACLPQGERRGPFGVATAYSWTVVVPVGM